MPFRKAQYRSELGDPVKFTALLKKIKELYPKKKTGVVFKKGLKTYEGAKLVSLTIDETLTTGTIIFDDGTGAQTYDKADVIAIRRIRSRKFEIVIKGSANPA